MAASNPVAEPVRGAALPEPLLVEVGAGELVDKITILRLKAERITAPDRLANVLVELAALDRVARRHLARSRDLDRLEGELAAINAALWTIEDDIRRCESVGDFGPTFVALARAVYMTNDRRAAVKKAINILVGAAIVEEKCYAGDP